ncbi:TonB-dependent receptor SusC [Polaribacter huanghezhanensis]|uniref:TonB-dependent receptor n=1 Tax=Polaribacter huanghezhanensis TaxID=1354726 RepID=UPI00264867C4|nr:TonB-dependent receptor [Polaribacter huanghezhanensis]WKD86350.1 TonB-dependent receptor SusC [Polaribacter huanghezhanensis]
MKIILKALFLLGCITVTAQNSLSGTITDINKEPLIGAQVYSTEFHKGAITDENGKYTLKNLPNGKVKISFSFIGYQEQTKTIEFNSENKTLDIFLLESVFTIDEVIISTPFNKLQSENVMKVERLTAAAIKRTGSPTLMSGLQRLAGVSQISTGTSIGKPVIRGLSGNRVLVYAQGVRLENQQFGDEHGLGLDGAGVESVEVIKGPASLLYGSDALGGVLYLNPEKFASENTTSSSFNQQFYSNTLGSNTSVGFKSSSEKWKLLGRISANYHSDYKTPNNQRVTNTRFKENDLKLGLGYNTTNFVSELRYNFNYSLLGIPENGIKEQTTSKRPEYPNQKVNNHILSLHNHFFLGKSKLDVDFGYIFNDRNEFENNPNPVLRMKLKTFNYNSKYHLPTFKNGVESILGLQGMHQTNKNFGEKILIPNAKINDIGVFYTINKQFETSSLQAGIRFDARALETEKHTVIDGTNTRVFNPIDKNYTSFTASLGYKFTLFDKITTRINTASGFRAPNLAELTSNGVHEGTNRYEVGNANLATEKNIQLDLSLEYKTDHIEIFGNGFYNHLNDYIYLSPTGATKDSAPVFEYTQHNAKLYGGEFGFHLHPHPIDWLHLESSFEMVIGKQQNGDYLPLIPANTFKNTLRTEFSIKNWLQNGYSNITVTSALAQKNIGLFETASSGYQLVSFGLGGDVALNALKFNTTLSINNLFDTKYINHLSRLKSDGILNAGRNIVLGVSFKI